MSNFERPLLHADLPKLGDYRINYLKIKVDDLERTNDHVVNSIIERFKDLEIENAKMS